jgi:SNF family Na+-dependent transporter
MQVVNDADASSGRWLGRTGYALAALGIAVGLGMILLLLAAWWMLNHIRI